MTTLSEKVDPLQDHLNGEEAGHHHGPDLKSYSHSGVRLDCRSTNEQGVSE
jgi:hypothetical protein